ncbi:glycosyltransferase family 4 protein, partial [Heyndrickxia sporothermodurans]
VDTWWYDRVFEAARRFGVPLVQNVNTPVAPYSADAEVVYVSRYVQEKFPSSVGRQRERVIYPGIDLKAFDLRPLSIDALDSIGMVYRLEHDKLNLEAIDPFIEVVRRRPRTRVIIVGGGSLLEPFREKVRVAGLERNFWFTGYVSYDELPGLYEQFSIFVAPVWKESFGQVTPFAMHMGRAVAGYDIGALSEILEDSSCLGHNTQELAGIILSLLADPARIRAAAERNREHARTKFSVEGMTEAYDRLYEELLRIENVDPLAAFPPATLFPR